MMLAFDEPRAAEAHCRAWRERGESVGFVPTMGALHEGHLALVARALSENDHACVSVFVNPLQFGERSDYELYPRDFASDARLLERAGCEMAFTGTLPMFFEHGVRADGGFDSALLRDPGPSAAGLEGDLRPGHFAGVATIVERLFEITEPTRAYFGAKDFQQTLVVKDLARRRGRPEIRVCPTVREPSGLARSSRNERLNASDRETATVLVRALRTAREEWRNGRRNVPELCASMWEVLSRAPVSVEYATVRDPDRWTRDDPMGSLERGVALVAARVAGVRLIDNMRLDVDEETA
jgi:pantoate--beta-alanine ligase